jgi:DNA-binding MurR/RpiR family transcriptional regulator
MTDGAFPPATADDLRARILERYDRFSKRLRQIARFVLDHPQDLAFETLAVIAERAEVQPSAIVRFAKALGFSGANPMQKMLRDSLLSSHASLGYGERVRHFNASVAAKTSDGAGVLLDEFVEHDVLALENLRATIAKADLDAAVRMIDQARTLYVMGFRRAFPIAAYLAYSLEQLGKRTVFLDGVGGMAARQAAAIEPADLLIAISYRPYAPETVDAAAAAFAAGAKVLSISDSLVGPIAKASTLVLQVRESEVRNFRSLSPSLCLAQTLVVGLAFERERRAGG